MNSGHFIPMLLYHRPICDLADDVSYITVSSGRAHKSQPQFHVAAFNVYV